MFVPHRNATVHLLQHEIGGDGPVGPHDDTLIVHSVRCIVPTRFTIDIRWCLFLVMAWLVQAI